MNYEEALNELKYDNEERDWDNCMFDMAGGVYEKCIEALEKQIPKKPTYTNEKNVYGAVVRICNECGDKVCISPMAKEYENYCRSCGKRLTDWSEVE